MDLLKENPFSVLTPDYKEEEITNAQVIHKLFVNVFEDFTIIPQQGHVFLNGPRGSGKSMMFRFLLPDCQLIDKKVKHYKELPFYSIHIPIKLTSINNPEYELIREYGNTILNEHVLTIYFSELIFDSFSKLNFANIGKLKEVTAEIKNFYHSHFEKRLKQCGWEGTSEKFNPANPVEAFKIMREICSDIFVQTNQFLKRNVQCIKYPNQFPTVSYNGPLCDYLTFLFPLLKSLKQISIFPNKPFFLLVDDADNLTETQTIVLNSWVSYRTNSEVSLKISTQLNYKTFNTITGTNIDSPHDYYDINILTVYSSAKDVYNKRVRQIVEKRLKYFYDKDVNPDDFFPQDKKQEKGIEKVRQTIRENFGKSGRGYRESDDVVRYAVPEYIRGLKGQSKSGSTYKYAGFNQLVSISSGIIRHFLTPAAKMFSTSYRDIKLKKNNASPNDVEFIPPANQNEEIRDYSTKQLFDEYDKLKKDKLQIEKDENYLSKIEKLRNLIDGLGGLFHRYLISEERSERRVFSFAISGNLEPELAEIIEIGAQYGYFHKGTIGKKNGTGKTRHYILSRILAPHFLLDPTGYAHYKFFTSAKLSKALTKPDVFIEEMMKIKEADEDKISQQVKIDFNNPIAN